VISGGSAPGSDLTCQVGSVTWGADLPESFLYRAPQSFGYQWSLNGSDIAGAISSSYPAFEPGTYTCRVIAANEAGSSSLTSAGHVVVGPTFTLSVSEAGTGSGTVTRSGISCPGTCSVGYAAGTSVTLTANPASGSSFSGWSGACTGTGTCTVTMNANQAVTATFTAGATSTGGGGGKPATCTLKAKSRRVTVRKLKKGQSGTLSLIAKCDQGIKITLKGTLTEHLEKNRKRKKTFRLSTLHASLSAGVANVLVVKLPAAAILALEHRTKESATFSLTATNTNGTSRASTTIAKLTIA
jgi:hypothetical protein